MRSVRLLSRAIRYWRLEKLIQLTSHRCCSTTQFGTNLCDQFFVGKISEEFTSVARTECIPVHWIVFILSHRCNNERHKAMSTNWIFHFSAALREKSLLFSHCIRTECVYVSGCRTWHKAFGFDWRCVEMRRLLSYANKRFVAPNGRRREVIVNASNSTTAKRDIVFIFYSVREWARLPPEPMQTIKHAQNRMNQNGMERDGRENEHSWWLNLKVKEKKRLKERTKKSYTNE